MTSENVDQVSEVLSNLTSEPEDISEDTLSTVATVLTDVVGLASQSEEVFIVAGEGGGSVRS